ncbi:O-antigen ligase family protein [Candidatus Pelagibacter sp.]|nr:O-antigen ligase family protein [Candidatus Pelagibacter sp.]
MKNNFIEIFKESLTVKILLFSILIFPIILLVGSAIINLSIVLMNAFFLIHVINEKKYQIFKNDIFYILIAFWFFLILNTMLNEDFNENYSRSFGFIRFILLIFLFTYFLSYKDYKFKKLVFNFWSIIFAVVTIDLIVEYIFGFNTLGFKTPYNGRLVGFMGDQLKIGHWYICFSLIVLANYFNQHKIFYFLLLLSIIVSFIIGERANFIRLFIAISLLVIIARLLRLKILILLIFFTSFFVYLAVTFDRSPGNGLKYRYFNQIYPVLKLNSIKEINNNNTYTPMYINAYDLFKKNKLLGVGPGSYLIKSHENFQAKKEINGYKIIPNTHPHQFHFEILATLGLPGYLFILIFLVYFLSKSLRFYIKKRDATNLTSFLFILIFCIPLLPMGSFFTTYGASLFWLNFSLMNLGNFKNINY